MSRSRTLFDPRLALVPAALFLLTGADTVKLQTDSGTLVVVIEEPGITATLDGEQNLKITGIGETDYRLKTGPHLFGTPGEEVLSLSRNGRVVVRVSTTKERPAKASRPREEVLAEADRVFSAVIPLRERIDSSLWAIYKTRWTHAEAAKLLARFYRGEGEVVDADVSPDEAAELSAELARLRDIRYRVFELYAEAAQGDAAKPDSPLVGAWQVVEIRGAGGLAADALDLFDPDPVGRWLAVGNGPAALYTGGGLWRFQVSYPEGIPGAVNFAVPARLNSVLSGRFKVDKDEATLRLSTFHGARPATAVGDPTDGSVVIRLRRLPAE